MKHSNGIEIAQGIRETNMRVFIVYISNYPDNMRRAFKVHAFDFIKKPFVKEDIHIVMDDYFSTRHDGSDEMILLHTDNGAVQIRENEIYYFILRAKKKIFVRTADGDMIVREHVDNIYNKLDENLFFRSRRDCIVNLRYVETVRKDDFVIVTKDGSFLPLAQRKQAEFINKLSTAFVDKLKGKNHE